MAKRHADLDTRNPFIPSRSPVCCLADQLLMCSVALVGLVAVAIALLRQVLR
jgi:hypothetical protein